MFVANRYYNSPQIAQASANLGDALFGSPQREYTRATTEATREATEDRRILRGRAQEEWDAKLRAMDALRLAGVATSPGQKDLEQALEIIRARGGRDPRDFAPPSNALPTRVTAGVPPGVDPAAYAAATPNGRAVYDSGNNGITYGQDWLEQQMRASGHWPPSAEVLAQQSLSDAAFPSWLMGQARSAPPQLGSGVLRPEAQTPEMLARIAAQSAGGQPPTASTTPSAPLAQLATPDDLYAVLEAFTDQRPGRLAPQDPGAYLADVMMAYGPETAMTMLASMQGQRNPYEELGVRALLGEQAGEIDFGRDLWLEKLKGDNALATARARRAGTGTGGAALDITPSELEKLKQLVTIRMRQHLPDPSDPEGRALIDPDVIEGITLKAAEIYQQTRNTGLAIDQAFEETRALEALPKKRPYGWWWGVPDYEVPQGDWLDYQ